MGAAISSSHIGFLAVKPGAARIPTRILKLRWSSRPLCRGGACDRLRLNQSVGSWTRCLDSLNETHATSREDRKKRALADNAAILPGGRNVEKLSSSVRSAVGIGDAGFAGGFAQVEQGTITGTTTDSSGGVMPNARVVIPMFRPGLRKRRSLTTKVTIVFPICIG